MPSPPATPRPIALLEAVLFLLGAQAFFSIVDATAKHPIRVYCHAPASLIAPFIHCQTVMATLSGWLFFGQFPDAVTLAGIAAILASGAASAVHEKRRARKK